MTTRRTEQVLAALRGAAPAPPATAPVPAASKPPGTVRFTFDITREQHRFIRRFVLDAETTASAATRELWSLVQDDSALAERLRSLLADREETGDRAP